MTKPRSIPRHRATSARTHPLGAVSANAGSLGRQAAVVAAASGLVLTIGLPAQGSVSAVRETTTVPAAGLDIERASLNTVTVAAAQDVQVDLDRAAVTSRPAPEPEPQPAADPIPAQQTSSEQQTTERASSQGSTGGSQQGVAPSAPAQQEEAPQRATGSMGAVVSAAHGGVGTPYVLGGKGRAGWDCSGFTAWAYGQAGISIPSSTSAIRASGKFVPTSNPRPGDLVFQNGGGHVGIYVGNGQMIGAQNPSTGTFQHSVDRNPLMGYYTYVG